MHNIGCYDGAGVSEKPAKDIWKSIRYRLNTLFGFLCTTIDMSQFYTYYSSTGEMTLKTMLSEDKLKQTSGWRNHNHRWMLIFYICRSKTVKIIEVFNLYV